MAALISGLPQRVRNLFYLFIYLKNPPPTLPKLCRYVAPICARRILILCFYTFPTMFIFFSSSPCTFLFSILFPFVVSNIHHPVCTATVSKPSSPPATSSTPLLLLLLEQFIPTEPATMRASKSTWLSSILTGTAEKPGVPRPIRFDGKWLRLNGGVGFRRIIMIVALLLPEITGDIITVGRGGWGFIHAFAFLIPETKRYDPARIVG